MLWERQFESAQGVSVEGAPELVMIPVGPVDFGTGRWAKTISVGYSHTHLRGPR